MAVTIPTCAALTAGGTAIQNYVTELYTWILANPGNFTVSNAAGGPVSSWTLTHIDGFQLNFRISGTTLLVMIAPDGGIVNSATPGTPTNYVEVIGLITPSSQSTKCHIARYEDAIYFSYSSSSNNYINSAFLIGRIFAPLQDQDAANGVDGLGILAAVPSDNTAVNQNYWYSSSTTRQSKARCGGSIWANGLTHKDNSGPTQYSAIKRFQNVSICGDPSGVAAASPYSSPIIYMSKYTAWACGPSDSITSYSLNESASTNQAWMALTNSVSSTRQRLLWDKTVDPMP